MHSRFCQLLSHSQAGCRCIQYLERVFYRGIHAQRYRPRERRGDGRWWARAGGLQAILSAISTATAQGEGQSQYQGHRAEEEIIVVLVVILVNVVVVSSSSSGGGDGGGCCNSSQLIYIMIWIILRYHPRLLPFSMNRNCGLERNCIANDSCLRRHCCRHRFWVFTEKQVCNAFIDEYLNVSVLEWRNGVGTLNDDGMVV